MRRLRVFSLKFIAFALTPTFILLLGAEITVRLKYFLAPTGHDWTYLTAPFGRGSAAASETWKAIRHDDTAVPKADDAAASKTRDTAPPQTRDRAAPNDTAAPTNQMVFTWQTPCVDQMVYSTELHKDMPRTWDENCFRGDRVTPQKNADEYRVVFVGGSTVEDAQSDAEMMTAQFKRVLPPTYRGKRTTVVNAGKANFGSRSILSYWDSFVHAFSPDLVLYYEAWNEQEGDVKFTGLHVDRSIAAFASYRLHRTLYYQSMLYTYLVERFGLRMIAGNHFWKIDVRELRHFTELARQVRGGGARFVFVTQIVRFPRMWKGVDTFDYRAVDRLIDRLRADPQYAYDVSEISALNQRLAVFYTIDLCREHDIPVLNILEPIEALGEAGRSELFTDLGHLTVKGDRIVGELIARRLHLSE